MAATINNEVQQILYGTTEKVEIKQIFSVIRNKSKISQNHFCIKYILVFCFKTDIPTDQVNYLMEAY